MIVTRFVYPPIPIRDLDWVAFVEGDEEGVQGSGETETEALRDLCERLVMALDEATLDAQP